MKKGHLISFLSAIVLSSTGLMSPVQAADPALVVHDAYVRLVPPGSTTSAAYVVLENTGTTDRQLVRAECPVAGTVELHTHINDNGVMKMRAVSAIPVPAKGQAQLKPGGDHLMLIDLKEVLKEGDNVPITLYFDDGSRQSVAVAIKRITAGMPAMDGAMKH